MDRGAWQPTVYRFTELDPTEWFSNKILFMDFET